MTLTTTSLDIPLVARGKVRDIYSLPSSPSTLLFITTDRVAPHAPSLETDARFPPSMSSLQLDADGQGIPEKGKILTQLSKFWFSFLAEICPNHFITDEVSAMPEEVHTHTKLLEKRSMLVKKCTVIPLEAIVRGYITGSGWKEYKQSGTVHGITMPTGLVESQKLDKPLFTPSTKAEQGAHDQNIHPDQLKQLIGVEKAEKVEQLALALYSKAASYAETRGIIIADTKFEFGETETGEIILIDEVLTPDSSRFWARESYVPGRSQRSFDKQDLRDWLTDRGLAGKDGGEIPRDVVLETESKYREVFEILTGQKWQD